MRDNSNKVSLSKLTRKLYYTYGIFAITVRTTQKLLDDEEGLNLKR